MSDNRVMNRGVDSCIKWHKACRVAFVVASLMLFGCNAAFLKDRAEPFPVKASEITGTVDLVLYGANHYMDLETIAILDVEGDGYLFEPYAPDFKYRVIKNLPADDALADALRFVGWHRSFHEARISKIADERGRVLGYEVRPLYYPFDFGIADVLDVGYFIRGGKVVVRINLDPAVERMLQQGSSPRDSRE